MEISERVEHVETMKEDSTSRADIISAHHTCQAT